MQHLEGDKTESHAWGEATHTWTWPQIARQALQELGGSGSLKELYVLIEQHPKTQGKHWRARLRETLQGSSAFVRMAKGVWSVAWKYSKEDVEELNRLRREAHPLLGPRTTSTEES